MKNTKPVDPTIKHSMKCPRLYGKKCTCDGYHTFNELYDHRVALWIALCRAKSKNRMDWIWRSKKHADGSSFKGWFVLGMRYTKGLQITYHLPMKDWKRTAFAKTLRAAPPFDGHSSDDVIKRLQELS